MKKTYIARVMKKYIVIKCFFVLFLAFLFQVKFALSQPAGEVEHTTQPGRDTIDIGMVLKGDSAQTVFLLKNTGTERLRILEREPTYSMGRTKDQDPSINDLREFDIFPKGFLPKEGLIISPNSDLNLIIQYRDSIRVPSDTALFPYGKKIARLLLGLMPENSEETVVQKEYILVCRKTIKPIDGFESFINFDSVYVNSRSEMIWLVQQNIDKPITVESGWLEMLSPVINKSEFSIAIDDEPIDFPVTFQKKGTQLAWQLFYQPLNRNADSGIYRISYHPQPDIYPDSVVIPWVKIKGTGVEQSIKLDTFNYEGITIIGDTIDVGDVRVGETKSCKISLENLGNLPFGASKQYILKDNTNELSTDFDIIKPFLNNNHLLPTKKDSVKIVFTPHSRGEIIAKYIIESDITTRKIKGVPVDAKKLVFYLRGKGIEPEIRIASDTVDFGNVVLSVKCPSEIDTLIPIANVGNSDLIIKSIKLYPPNPSSPFSVEPSELTIPYNINKIGIDNIKITFKSSQIGEFLDTLLLISNSIAINDTIIVYLKAIGVPPVVANLKIPDEIRGKPGNKIRVPIVVDNSHFARTFEDVIFFNNTILRYESYSTLGTAAEIVPDYLVNISEGSTHETVRISIACPPSSYFLDRDTLLILIFNTYLGDRTATQISFTDPKFGDGICNNVLDTKNFKNGRFILDSICGLSLKTLPFGENVFSLINSYPNPADKELNIEYSISFKTNVCIELYNTYGELAGTVIDNVLPSGTYIATYNSSNLPLGVYYVRMKAGIFSGTKIISITR